MLFDQPGDFLSYSTFWGVDINMYCQYALMHENHD